MNKIRVIVAGGRDFDDYELMKQSIYQFMELSYPTGIIIISGDANGADKLGMRFAKEHDGVGMELYPALWRGPDGKGPYNNAAGYERNIRMAAVASHLLAFWDGKSRGTKHMIDIADREYLVTEIIKYEILP